MIYCLLGRFIGYSILLVRYWPKPLYKRLDYYTFRIISRDIGINIYYLSVV